MANIKANTARLRGECVDCGWPVIDACCNDGFLDGMKDKHGEPECWDWWLYCSNKGCKNHRGEGLFQNTITWVRNL